VCSMKSYLELLQSMSNESGIDLLHAFKQAGIPTSTFYRTINGRTELRHDTAHKVMTALEKLHALKKSREYTRSLQESGTGIDIRKIRSKFKPRRTGA